MMLLGEFLDQMSAKGYSPGTISYNKLYLEKFLDYLRAARINNIQAVSPRTMSQYSHYLLNIYRKSSGDKLHPSTICQKLNAVKKYFAFLLKRGYIFFDPTRTITLPRSQRHIPRNIPTESEMERLLERPDTCRRSGLRDRTILELLYSTGIRKSELINLNLYDLDTNSGILRVIKGKGGKDRVVPVGKVASYWVSCYIREVRSRWVRAPREKSLFVNALGQRLSSALLSFILGTYSKGIGERKITCHSLRHACATHMLRGGADIRIIQELLGHRRLETTEIYTRVTPVDLRETLKRYHPRERKER